MSIAQRLQADHAVRLQETANFQVDGPEKSLGPTTRGTCCKEIEALRTWCTWKMVTCVSPNLGAV